MSISPLNVGVTALRVGFYGLNGIALFLHIFPSWVYKSNARINDGEVFDFANRVVTHYGIKKEVVLIKDGSIWGPLGGSALPGSAVLLVPDDAVLNEDAKDHIKFRLALISLNVFPLIYLISIIAAIAARWIIMDRFPMYATLAELGCGVMAFRGTAGGFFLAARKMVKAVPF